MAQNESLNGHLDHLSENHAESTQIVSPQGNLKYAILTEDELISYLKDFVRQIGRITDAAEQMEISAQFLGAILAGRKKPGKKLLDRLGVETVYRLEVG